MDAAGPAAADRYWPVRLNIYYFYYLLRLSLTPSCRSCWEANLARGWGAGPASWSSEKEDIERRSPAPSFSWCSVKLHKIQTIEYFLKQVLPFLADILSGSAVTRPAEHFRTREFLELLQVPEQQLLLLRLLLLPQRLQTESYL